ncbi:MAG: ABC transporter permease [Candidatus Tritonobacter lacicola]|nr:ABC transporter permease [Candidatus Tritonobacter lacicola]
MISLAISNLQRRKVRSAICILAVALGITLLLVLVGLCSGVISESSRRVVRIGADIIVQPAGSSYFLGLRSGNLPVAYAGKIEEIDGVAGVSPLMTWTTTINNVIHVIYGIDLESFDRIGAGLSLKKGRYWTNDNEVMVDERLAKATGYKVGDEVTFLARPFTICGIYRAGIGSRVSMPLPALQDLLKQKDKASLFFIKCASRDENVVSTVAEEIAGRYPGLRPTEVAAYAEALQGNIDYLDEFIGTIISAALIISFLVILLALYTTILERTREIGILRAIGATRSYIMRSIVLESVILCAMGVLVGYLLSFLSTRWILFAHPLLTIETSTGWIVIAGGLGILGGVLGALYPALRASFLDPIEALRYE